MSDYYNVYCFSFFCRALNVSPRQELRESVLKRLLRSTCPSSLWGMSYLLLWMGRPVVYHIETPISLVYCKTHSVETPRL